MGTFDSDFETLAELTEAQVEFARMTLAANAIDATDAANLMMAGNPSLPRGQGRTAAGWGDSVTVTNNSQANAAGVSPRTLGASSSWRGSGPVTLHARFGHEDGPSIPVQRRRWLDRQPAYADDGPEVALWGRSNRHI